MSLKIGDFTSFLSVIQSFTGRELEEAKSILKNSGKEIESLEDIFVNPDGGLYEILPDGTLVKINLYIATKETSQYFQFDNFSIDDLYKYHLYQCTTLSNMFNSGRKHRYKINNRDDGTFHYTFSDQSGNILKIEKNQKLHVCKNCLKIYLKKSYVNDDVRSFDLKSYHDNNTFFPFMPNDFEQGEDAKPNVYPQNWDNISQKLKKMRHYTCEKCGYKPKSNYEKKFIHTHHSNGDKQNNSHDNLKVLCIKCHADVDSHHAQIKNSPAYKEFCESVEMMAL